jgi:hypothetical protein
MTAPGQQAAQTPPQAALPPVAPPPVAPTQNRATRRAEKVHAVRRLAANATAPSKVVRDTITAAHATLALGGLDHVAHVPMVYPGALGVVLAAAGAWWGNRRHEMMFGGVIGASAGGWLMWSAATTPWGISNIATLAIAATGAGVWYGKVLRTRRQAAALGAQYTAAMTVQAGTETARVGWQEILEAAGCKGVVITSTKSLEGGASGFRITGRLTDPKFNFDALSGQLGAIELTADNRTDYPIRPGSIQLGRAKGATAGQFEITVPTADIFGQAIPHPIDHSPRSIEDPIFIATAADGSRISVTHNESAHGMFSGMTDFGKSNLLNCHIFEWTRCTDAVTWLISGSDKSAKLFKPLLRAWLKGEIPNPPIDRFAGTEEEAMRVLWDARMGIRSRGHGSGIDDLSSKWPVTPETPRIMIGIEEAGDYLASDTKHRMPDGKKWTFGQLLLEVIRKARSEAINLLMLTQGGTMDLTGDYGSGIKKQILYRVAFHAQSFTETNACLATDTSRVELGELDKGEIYVERAGDRRPILALADYMEDGAKNNVMDLAARMHHQYAQEVDAATAAAMPFYRDRWTRPEQQEYLAGLLGMSVENIVGSAANAHPTNAMAAFEQWATEVHPGEAPTQELFEQFIQETWQDATPGDRAEFLADHDDGDDDSNAFSQRMQAIVDKYRAEVESAEEVATLERVMEVQSRTLGDLDAKTLRVVGVIQKITADELTADELRSRVAADLGMEDNTETDRYVNAAIRDILGVKELDTSVKRRRTLNDSDGNDRKSFVWNVGAIKQAIRDMGR